MKVKFVFVYAFLLALGESRNSKECSSPFVHRISISVTHGHDIITCVSQSSVACKTLDYVLTILMNGTGLLLGLRNSTKIEIEGLQSLKKNHNLTNLTDFALCGVQKNTEIECGILGIGVVIRSSVGISIEHIRFHGCGSLQRSNDNNHRFFYSGIFLSNTVDVSVNHCTINNSTGIGMTFFDVGGSVIFSNTVFRGNSGTSTNRNKTNMVPVGGGLIIEFTFGGGSSPFKASNNTYNFFHCQFIENNCTWNKDTNKNQLDPTEQIGKQSSIFGNGGGMGMNFKGLARNNQVVIEHCEFRYNSADWGGGYCFSFQDESQNNVVELNTVLSESNTANFAGGGGRFEFYPNVNFTDVFKFHPNYFKHTNCKYLDNTASWGGGISVFGTTGFPAKNKKDLNLTFTNCHWLQNRAAVGSALGLISDWLNPSKRIRQPMGQGFSYNIKLVNCIIKENFISHNFNNYVKSVIGTGTIYSDIAPITMQNVSLSLNNGTALVLDWSDVYILENVTFFKNNGSRGGAIALYGRSTIILGENASLYFINNLAELQGGAIYAYSQGPNLKAFDIRILDRSTCFFSYFNSCLPPLNWTAKVFFQNNSAPPKSGNSIYTDTLQFCRNYGNLTDALQWRSVFNGIFHDYEIVTDPVIIYTTASEWKVFPGEMFYPKIDLRDEKNQSVNGLLKIEVMPHSSVKIGKQTSHYVYVSHGTSANPLVLDTLKNTSHYNLILSSVFTQIIKSKLENIEIISDCYGGYVFDSGDKKCVCLGKDKMPFGYSRCEGDGKTIYLKKEYWGSTVPGKQFDVYPCPQGYCKCVANNFEERMSNETDNECLFVEFTSTTEQCTKNRKGRLCGSCKREFSVLVGTDECTMCDHNEGILWIFLIVVLLTFAVLVVIYFELDFFSGPLNSWLYTYHIIHLLPYSSSYLDPFINFVISLTNGTFDVSSGKCIWVGMDALQKLSLAYLMPVYCVILLYAINKLLHYIPNLSLSSHSFHSALVTIFIISYASLLRSTVTILQPIVIHDEAYVYVQADFKYFGNHHLPYAIPALLILFGIVIPFPFIIAFNNFFTDKFRCFRNFVPLFQVLQSPYRIDRSWFASYYIFCRLIFVFVYMASSVYQYSIVTVFGSISIFILVTFVFLQPYTEENRFFFKVDTVFLSLLCLIISFTHAIQINQDTNTELFFRTLIRIATYIPLFYSAALLVNHVRKRWNNYRQGRGEGENRPITPLVE